MTPIDKLRNSENVEFEDVEGFLRPMGNIEGLYPDSQNNLIVLIGNMINEIVRLKKGFKQIKDKKNKYMDYKYFGLKCEYTDAGNFECSEPSVAEVWWRDNDGEIDDKRHVCEIHLQEYLKKR